MSSKIQITNYLDGITIFSSRDCKLINKQSANSLMSTGPSMMAIVPCYNEEGRIGKTLQRLMGKVDRICVINDGSTDLTFEEADNFDVDIINYPSNKGKGYAIRQGIDHFLKSNIEVAIFMDGDGQHAPEDIPKFISKFKNENAEVVIASRFGTEEWVNNMPFIRKISNLLSRFGLWLLYNGLIIEDPQNGFRAFRRKVIDNIQFKTSGYEAEMEILIDAFLKGYKFDKVYVQSIYNQEENHSKFSLLMDTWKIPKIMLQGFFKHKPYMHRSLENKLKFRNYCKKN